MWHVTDIIFPLAEDQITARIYLHLLCTSLYALGLANPKIVAYASQKIAIARLVIINMSFWQKRLALLKWTVQKCTYYSHIRP